MRKHDCVIIGDSMSAIHAALQFAHEDLSVLLIKQDIFPVELFETDQGVFECDLSTGIDLPYYFNYDNADNLYGLRNQFESISHPFRSRTKNLSFIEPGDDDIFLKEIYARWPNYNEAIMRFFSKISYVRDIVNEIEVKTGLVPEYPKSARMNLFTKIDTVSFRFISRMMNRSFKTFLSQFGLPEDMLVHYTLMCHDHLGLSPDSVDTIAGIDLITRRRFGMSRPINGWISLKDTMFDDLRKQENISVIGGKKIDLVKSSAGFVYEIYVDERDVHNVNWLIIDETIGLLGFEGHETTEGRFSPLGFYSCSHLDFKLCLGWNVPQFNKWEPGVYFVYVNSDYPPQAPHMVRIDVMPIDTHSNYDLKAKLTIRGRYPIERIKSSWGATVDFNKITKEIMNTIDGFISIPENEPSFSKLIIPRNYANPFDNTDLKTFSPRDFASRQRNVKIINSSGMSGGNLRFAFRSAERITSEIMRKIKTRKNFEDLILKPIGINSGSDTVVDSNYDR